MKKHSFIYKAFFLIWMHFIFLHNCTVMFLELLALCWIPLIGVDFFFFWRENAYEQWWEGQRERENLKQTPRWEAPELGLDLTNLRSWPELKSRVRHSIYWATQEDWVWTFLLYSPFLAAFSCLNIKYSITCSFCRYSLYRWQNHPSILIFLSVSIMNGYFLIN